MSASESEEFESADEGEQEEEVKKRNQHLSLFGDRQCLVDEPDDDNKEVAACDIGNIPETSPPVTSSDATFTDLVKCDSDNNDVLHSKIQTISSDTEQENMCVLQDEQVKKVSDEKPQIEKMPTTDQGREDETKNKHDVSTDDTNEGEVNQVNREEAKKVGNNSLQEHNKKESVRRKRRDPKVKLGAKKLGAQRIPKSEIEKNEELKKKFEQEDEEKKKIENVASVEKSEIQEDQEDASWGWSSWGSSFLSSTSYGVSTLKTNLTEGIQTVIETVESGFGAPEPEEMARERRESEELYNSHVAEWETWKDQIDKTSDEKEEAGGLLSGFGNLMSGTVSQLSKVVEQTGTRVITGGLDTLEMLGKKTMNVLQEGDPLLRKKRAMLFGEKPVLSQVLREAKEKSEAAEKERQSHDGKEQKMRTKVDFNKLFDNYQGLVHLEALEALSHQSKVETTALTKHGSSDSEMLQEIQDLCEIDETEMEGDGNIEQDLQAELEEQLQRIGITVSLDNLCRSCEDIQSWLSDETCSRTADEIHDKCVDGLAMMTAGSMEVLHKTGEMLLLENAANVREMAQGVKGMSMSLCRRISYIANQFSQHLNKCETEPRSETISSLITNMFIEASNSTSYIQDAALLLVPVLYRIHLQS